MAPVSTGPVDSEESKEQFNTGMHAGGNLGKMGEGKNREGEVSGN